MSEIVTIAIAGMGARGYDVYAQAVKESKYPAKIVAIADIKPERIRDAAKEFSISEENCYGSAEEMFKQEKLADIAMICTQDQQHKDHAIAALEKGYHLLLEKPMATNMEDCKLIEEAAKRYKREVAVCHVLRYTPFYRKIKSLLEEGRIGEIVSIQATEHVGYWHQAHSFVRGNWGNSEESCPMILAKSCHDMDILLWLSGQKSKAVSSFGSLSHFKEEKAPEGATLRCTDECKQKDVCPYNAVNYYTGELEKGNTGWPVSVVSLNPTKDSIMEALKTGPYGRCVYHCDNDVVDNQVVNILMENDTTISFTMCGLTEKNYRDIKIMGSQGEIRGNTDTNIVEVNHFKNGNETIDITKLAADLSGHGGGDKQMIDELLKLTGEKDGTGEMLTSIEKSMESHYVSLSAEYSRLHNGEPVHLD